MQRLRVAAGLMLGALCAPMTWAQVPTHQDFSCVQGTVSRLVSIVSSPPAAGQAHGSCRVEYTKDGVVRTLWSANTGHAFCVKKATAFVTKLAEAHYECHLKTQESAEK